jgi:hypothetical protein
MNYMMQQLRYGTVSACEHVWELRTVQGRNNEVLSKHVSGHESIYVFTCARTQ